MAAAVNGAIMLLLPREPAPMHVKAHGTTRARFGAFELELPTGELRRSGMLLHLSPQPFKVLNLLLHRPGDLVTREELRQQVWGEETFVDFEQGLNFAIKKIRDTLGDDADHPRYIETLPRRGYRFIAPVEWFDQRQPASGPKRNGALTNGNGTSAFAGGSLAPMPLADSRVGGRSLWHWAGVAAGIVIVFSAVWWVMRRPLPPPRISEYIQLTHDDRWKEVAGADNDRLYVNLLNTDTIAQSPLTGGELALIPIHLPGDERPIAGFAGNDHPYLFDITADGSTFLSWGPTYSLWTATNTGDPIRNLGQAQGAAFSPDGKWIVYSWRDDVFTMRSDGTDSRMIVSAKTFPVKPGLALWPDELSWSPDGSRIRLIRDHDFWEVSPSGANLHRVLPGWLPQSWKFCGRWTPDGAFFIFLTGDPSITPLLSGTHLWALDERRPWFGSMSRQPVQLTYGPMHWGCPIPARDSSRIFARGVVLNGELIRYDRRAGQWAPYLGGKSEEFVAFSPDRKSIAFVAFPDGVLYRANLDGTAPMKLTEPPLALAVQFPGWSPDGRQILIQDEVGNGDRKLYVIPAQGGPAERVIPDDIGPESDPSWSPDGTRIVYSSTSDGGFKTLNPTQIRIFDLASRKIAALPGSGEEFSPRWSPDGRYIAALTISEHKLKVFDLKRQRWTMVYEGSTNLPTWSADGKYIYFLGDPDVMRVPVGGGKAETVASLKNIGFTGSLGDWFGLDPEDAPLWLRNKGTDEVYALLLERK